jgi:hypothetical protein
LPEHEDIEESSHHKLPKECHICVRSLSKYDRLDFCETPLVIVVLEIVSKVLIGSITIPDLTAISQTEMQQFQIQKNQEELAAC